MKRGCAGLSASACAVCDSAKQASASGTIRNARRKGEQLIGFIPFGVVVVDLNMFIVIFLFLLLTLSRAKVAELGQPCCWRRPWCYSGYSGEVLP